jgi:hypothetical protein
MLHVLESLGHFLTIFFQVTEEKDPPPTTLQAMLNAYMQEEQLTGNNQWRLVHSVSS